MNRRGFLHRAVGSAGACGGLAGCADLSVGGGGRVATERDPPDRPDELAPESVAEYVAAYEEVHAHNRYAAEGAVEVTVDADASIDHASGNDHYATAQHAGSVSHEHDDGARSVGEVYADPVPYLVTPDRTLRMAVERRAVEADVQNGDGGDGGNDTAPDDERTSFPLGVRLLNVTEEARELTLTVTRRGMADGRRGAVDHGRARRLPYHRSHGEQRRDRRGPDPSRASERRPRLERRCRARRVGGFNVAPPPVRGDLS